MSQHQFITDKPSHDSLRFGFKYFIKEIGKSCGADVDILNDLRKQRPGLKKMDKVDDCDVILVFCPIVSRAGSNIDAALKELNTCSASKPAVFMVLHHTIEEKKIISDSSKYIKRRNTLTVNFLFNEDDGLLNCDMNRKALIKITEHFNPQEKNLKNDVCRVISFVAILLSTQLRVGSTILWQQVKRLRSWRCIAVLLLTGACLLYCITNGQGIDQDEIPIVGKQKTKSKEIDETLKDKDVCVASELLIVLLGMSGSGKTAAKNMIFEREGTNQAGDSTGTQEIKAKRGSVDMYQVCVIDTPDYWFSSGFSMEQMKEKIQLISMCCGGPHAFLLVIPVKNEFTKEEREMVKNMEKMFEEICCEKVMILFTIIDEAENQNIDLSILSLLQHPNHQDLLKKCGERFHLFSLSQKGSDQVTQLLEKIQKMVKGNKESSDEIGIDIAHQTPNLERERNYMKVQYYMRAFWISRREFRSK